MSSRSLNMVLLIGNLTRDPEVRYTASGTPVSTFGLATNRAYKDNNGKEVESVEYHSVVTWSKLAEICGKLLKKGMKVYIQGRLQTNSWVDKETSKNMYRTEVVATDMKILSSKLRGDNDNGPSGDLDQGGVDDVNFDADDLNLDQVSDNDDNKKTPF